MFVRIMRPDFAQQQPITAPVQPVDGPKKCPSLEGLKELPTQGALLLAPYVYTARGKLDRGWTKGHLTMGQNDRPPS